MRTIRHSKYKNPGIIFELLIRQITVDILNEKNESKAVDIIKEFYSDTELAKEFSMYHVLINEQFENKQKAEELIKRVIENRKKLDEEKLKEEKYNLVGKIKENYPSDEFFKTRIPKYTEYASVYKIFEANKDDTDIHNPVDVMESKETLIEHITNKDEDSEALKEYKEKSREIRMYAQKLMIERFNKKYDNLSEEQKVLLRKYINNISNTNNLKDYLNEEVDKVKSKLEEYKENINDKVTRIKIDKALELAENIKTDHFITEDQIKNMLMYYQLVNKIENKINDR